MYTVDEPQSNSHNYRSNVMHIKNRSRSHLYRSRSRWVRGAWAVEKEMEAREGNGRVDVIGSS